MRVNLVMLIVGIVLLISCATEQQKKTERPVENPPKNTNAEKSALTSTIDSIQKIKPVKEHTQLSSPETNQKIAGQTDKVKINSEPVSDTDNTIEERSLPLTYQLIIEKYDHVPFYFEAIEKSYFIVVNGTWDRYSLNSRSGRNQFKMGMVDLDGNEVLPVDLSGIHNPGIFGKSWIEIERGDKSGLFNIESGVIIKPQFSLLMPSQENNGIAIAKKNDQYFTITSDGNISPIKVTEEIPQFLGLKKGLLFRTTQPGIIQMHLTKMIQKNLNGIHEGTGVVFTPSYIKKLNVMYESFQGIVSSEIKQKMEFGTVGGISQITDVVEISPDIKAYFVKFHTSGVDIDEYSIDKQKVVTVSRNNEVIDSKNVLSSFNNEKPFCKNSAYTVIDNSLIEIIKYAYPAESFQDYSKMPIYTYKKIGSDGSIKMLNSNRFFDFTEFVKIDESYLNDCLLKNNDQESPDYVAGEYDLLVLKHYNTVDLQIMINEIYATYGKIFTEKRWDDYFKAKPWYVPTKDDVTNQLSETDLYNITLIEEIISKMKGNEEDFIKKDALIYAETDY